MAVYTKTGDKGLTGIHGGQRVPKDNIRIQANGEADELNSVIGVVRAYLPTEHEWQKFLYRIQKEMMTVMSLIATPSDKVVNNPNTFDDSLILDCEQMIDAMHEEMGKSRDFLLPGGNLVSAHLHLARTVARRCERRLWTLHKEDTVLEIILMFFNRLSDLFFVMARYELFVNEEDEEVWQKFAYKSKRKP